MADVKKLMENLESKGYRTSFFETAQEAVDYLDSQIDGASVGFGGSVTLQELGIYDRLATHNNTIWHWQSSGIVAEVVDEVSVTTFSESQVSDCNLHCISKLLLSLVQVKSTDSVLGVSVKPEIG